MWQQPGKHVEKVAMTVLEIGLSNTVRCPQLHVSGEKIRILFQHTDDFIAVTIQHESAAHHVGVTAEPSCPEFMTQYHHEFCPRSILPNGKNPAQERTRAQHGKEVARNPSSRDHFWLTYSGECRSAD
jgi:hypothetical protein